MSSSLANLIFRHEDSPLSTVPFHKSIEFIKRTIPPNFPVHLSVHEIAADKKFSHNYAYPHCHDYPEINILIGNDLEFSYLLDNESFVVSAISSIWIPSGLKHSANVIKGSGHFVCIILGDPEKVFKI